MCSQLRLRVSAPADCPAGCALLLYALRDLGLQLYTLGSGDAVGRGRIDVESVDIASPDGRTAGLTFDGERNCKVSDPSGLIAGWLREWEVHP